MKITFYTGNPNNSSFFVYLFEDGRLSVAPYEKENIILRGLSEKECKSKLNEDGVAVSYSAWHNYISFKVALDQILPSGRRQMIFATVENVGFKAQSDVNALMKAIGLFLSELSLTIVQERMMILRSGLLVAHKKITLVRTADIALLCALLGVLSICYFAKN